MRFSETRTIAQVQEILSDYDGLESDFVEKVFNDLCEVHDPNPPETLKNIMAWDDKAVSRKPLNIIIDWRTLVNKIPEIGLTLNELSGQGIIRFLAALQLVKSILELATIEFGKTHAHVLYAFGITYQYGNVFSEEQGFATVENFVTENKIENVTKSEFDEVINDLLKIRAISMSDGNIKLQERIGVRRY